MSHAQSPFGFSLAHTPAEAYTSADLVQDFLYYTADLPLESAAEIAAVSTATLTRWRMMGARQLRSDVRDRLHHYVKSREAGKKELQAA
ncbi:MAG TPA: hypothetical protein VFI96_01825 [Longimicrobiaceae bacterium]|nr:hypothetical protein [Longimicrobiaceae bacterium]